MLLPPRSLLILGGLAFAAVPSDSSQPVTPVVWRSISAGPEHTCGLSVDGVAYCWGWNLYGQLGDGTRNSRYIPVPVAVRAGLRFQSLAVGDQHTCGLSVDGTAWCWGDNRNGALGDRTRVTRVSPVAVAGRLRFKSISASGITCAVAESGILYCWGGSSLGPVAVAEQRRFVSIDVGGRLCGLTADSTAVCWNEMDEYREPAALPGGLRFARLTPGARADCGVTADGAAYCWGEFVPGRQENPAPASRAMEPFRVASGQRFRSIHLGQSSACGLTLEGVLYCWGEGPAPIPGVPEQAVSTVPAPVAVEQRFVSLTLTPSRAFGVTADGVAYGWGQSGGGLLGDGTTIDRPTPVRVAEPAAAGATDIPGPPVVVRRTVTRLILPANYDPARTYPVIVFFPPLLGSETRPMGRYTSVVSDYVVMLPTDTVRRDSFDGQEDPSEIFERFERGLLADLPAVAATHRLDTTRVVLVGFSGGGDMAWTFVQRYPTRFSGAILMGSRAGYRAPLANLQSLAQRRARFFFALGDGEAPGTLTALRSAMTLLQRNGIEHRFASIPESDHVPAPAAMFAEALAFVLGPR